MTKRHRAGEDIVSRIGRVQESIMAHTGLDEFTETIRLLLAKVLAEKCELTQLPSLEEANSLLTENGTTIQEILGEAPSLLLPEFVYQEARDALGEFRLLSQDASVLDEAFEKLVARSYKSDKGQYFTPRHVVEMCVRVLAPGDGESVCDPACGSGAFLSATYLHSLRTGAGVPNLFGFDYSKRAVQVARLASFLLADRKISIDQLDSLALPCGAPSNTIESAMGEEFGGYDVILTNPPFAGDVSTENYASGYDVSAYYPRRIERDILFVERVIRLLRDGGRFAIVLPDNKVSGRAFRDLRYWLLKNAEVRAVVSLHRYTFLPHTSQKAAVLFGVKRPPALQPYQSEVAMFRSDTPGKTSNGSPVFRTSQPVDGPPFEVLEHDLGSVVSELELRA